MAKKTDLFSPMSHTQLSMIASHLARGGALCCWRNCPDNADAVATIAHDRATRERLGDWAQDALGCHCPSQAMVEYYLEKFLAAV